MPGTSLDALCKPSPLTNTVTLGGLYPRFREAHSSTESLINLLKVTRLLENQRRSHTAEHPAGSSMNTTYSPKVERVHLCNAVNVRAETKQMPATLRTKHSLLPRLCQPRPHASAPASSQGPFPLLSFA